VFSELKHLEGRIPPIIHLFNKTSARKEHTMINQYFFKTFCV